MKNSFKKFFWALVLVVAFVFSTNGALISTIGKANAYTYQETSDVEVENGDFSSYTKGNTGAPYSLTDKYWDLSTDSTVIAGVVSTDADTFKTNNFFGLSSKTDNPETDESIDDADDYVLMFRSSTNGKGSATSDEFTLSKDTYYRIDIHVYTAQNALASAYLSTSTTTGFTNISTSVTTGSVWKIYSFYVSTDILNDVDTTLTLCYGASKTTSTSGVVFFDNAEVYEISNEDYENATGAYSVQVDENRTSQALFNNSDFEQGLDSNWVVADRTDNDEAIVNVSTTAEINTKLNQLFADSTSTNRAKTNVSGNTKSLVIINEDETTSTVSSTDTNVATIAQHQFYALTFLLKTGDLSGTGLTVTLTPKTLDDEGNLIDNADLDAVSVTGLTSTGLDAYNGFDIETIYIKGGLTSDELLSISFSLPDSSGWAIIDDIAFVPVTQAEYESNADDDDSLDYSSVVTDSGTISNGYFSSTDNESLNESYPLKPLDWTYSGADDNAKSGVVRINPTYYATDASNFGNPANPGVDLDYYTELGYSVSADENNFNENVLMIRNTSSEDASYESDSFTIDANTSDSTSTTKISVGVKTLGTAKAFIKVLDSDDNVVAMINNISSTNWDTYKIYITNGLSSMTLTLVLGVEGNGNNNYAFFDFVELDDATTDTTFTSTDGTAFYQNYMTDSFISHNSTSVASKVFENTTFSMYATSTENSNSFYGVTTATTRSDASDKNVLLIDNILDEYQTLISNYTYSLTADSYYEFSVWIKTDFTGTTLNGDNFGGHFEVVALDDDGNVAETDEDNTNVFTNVVVSGTNNNGWVKYSIYILCEEDQDVKVILGMGDEDNLTQGKIYFDDLTVTDIDETEYAEVSSSANTIVSSTITLSTTDDDDDEDEDTSSTTTNLVNFWALGSSIILVLALVFAIAGYIIRQIPKKKLKKVSKNKNYVISMKKVKQQDIAVELKIKRDKDLLKLGEELTKVKHEYDDLKSQYEKNVDELDEVEIRPVYKTYAKSANKLLERIEYLNSAIAFLNDPVNIKQAEHRELRRQNKQNKLEYERQLREEYEKLNSDEEKNKKLRKNRKQTFGNNN